VLLFRVGWGAVLLFRIGAALGGVDKCRAYAVGCCGWSMLAIDVANLAGCGALLAIDCHSDQHIVIVKEVRGWRFLGDGLLD